MGRHKGKTKNAKARNLLPGFGLQAAADQALSLARVIPRRVYCAYITPQLVGCAADMTILSKRAFTMFLFPWLYTEANLVKSCPHAETLLDPERERQRERGTERGKRQSLVCQTSRHTNS